MRISVWRLAFRVSRFALIAILLGIFIFRFPLSAGAAGQFPPNAAAAIIPPAGPAACGSLTPGEVYSRLKQSTFSHNAYSAVYYHATERGARHEVFARG